MSAKPALDSTSKQSLMNLARLKLIAVAGPLFLQKVARNRILRLLKNYMKTHNDPPLVVPMGNAAEIAAAQQFALEAGPLGRFLPVYQENMNSLVGTALKMFREEFGDPGDDFQVKRQMLVLTRRGGRGKPEFVSPFLGGAGTTCGVWTKPVDWTKEGKPIKGFMKASVANGFCPVECRFCFLQSYGNEAMEVALNLEDLRTELVTEWRGFDQPINFGETGGLVELDEWFAGADGEGSLVQSVIDGCESAGITPFFLTKVRYPKYLQFRGNVQVGISLMPDAIREELAPFGSPAHELLDGLAWAVSQGAVHPVIRLFFKWEDREEYPELLELCRDRLGNSGWRLTLDILRFTPGTATRIAKHYPDVAEKFAQELSPDLEKTFVELAVDGRDEKKIRPPASRQREMFRWIREQLDQLGCEQVELTGCKGDPVELEPLVHEGILKAMACACHRPS